MEDSDKGDSVEFKTRDLYLAGYLMIHCKLIRVEGSETKANNPGLNFFIFDDSEDKCSGYEMDWTNSEAHCEASKYADKLIKLKKLCHTKKNSR